MRRLPFLLLLLLLGLGGCPRPEGPSQSPKASPAADLGVARGAALPPSTPPAARPSSPADMAPVSALPVVPPPVTEPSKTVKLRLSSSPKTQVRWGKKILGVTPLSVERPRDSGPLDLVFVAHGYFPVHTRAFTFKNDSLHISMTKHANRATLYGAKKEPPAPPPCDPTAGPCPPLPAAGTVPTPAPGTTPAPAPAPAPTPGAAPGSAPAPRP